MAPSPSLRFSPASPSLRFSPNPSSNGDTATSLRARTGIEAAPAAIHVEAITKAFGGTAALDGIDLDIRGGELLALLGPSGSGKTTLLRVIAGLESISSGRVLFGDEDATRLAVQRRHVGFVFQHYALFRHMTVADNIAYGLSVRPRAQRPSRADIRRRVSELLDLVRLPGLERRYPGQLSGGQRQRVALARALAVDPKVLLLDEPFGALDAQVRRDLRRWLREIHERTGHTTIFVTHDQDEALELADRVAVLNRGRIEQIGTPDEIYDRPASAFVAGFVGEPSRLDVLVADGKVRLGDVTLAPAIPNAPAGPAALFIRPADIDLEAATGPRIAATVAGVRRAGAVRRVELLVADGHPPVEAEIAPGRVIARGDTVGFSLKTLRLFPSH
nr:sulfate/molybdate ABC transporter ATP-binding protein [Phreatobacter sp.]